MIEAMKQALEALEIAAEGGGVNFYAYAEELRQAIREHAMYEVQRLGQEIEQGPVATVTSETGADITMSWWHEPALPIGTKLYTHLPKRTWVGLTNEEIESYWDWEDFQTGAGRLTIFEMVRDIEAKLKEKNT